jgi:hypothetical protein
VRARLREKWIDCINKEPLLPKREVFGMLRLGSKPENMREMELDDIFISRLQLLVIMTKSYLSKYPLGSYRERSIIENAEFVKVDAVGLAEDIAFFGLDEDSQNGLNFEPVFYQRVKLLAVMAEAFAKGHSLEEHKQEALEKNLNTICETITFSETVSDMQFLKVA